MKRRQLEVRLDVLLLTWQAFEAEALPARGSRSEQASEAGAERPPMRYKPLGKTVFVSELCLGTMTFGGKGFWQAIGKLAHAEVGNRRYVARRRHQLHRHGGRLLRGRVGNTGGRRAQSAWAAARADRGRHQSARARGPGRQPGGALASSHLASIDGSLSRLGLVYDG